MARMLRWLCLLLPILFMNVGFGTGAVPRGRRGHLDPLDPDREEPHLYYAQNKGFYCQKCPPGSHFGGDCKEPNGSSTCVACEDGDYMDYPNTFHSCYECRKCREDQVQLSPCQADRNTECACKEGTFCSPNQPCEMCQKCQRQCPEGQVVLAACTPYSDLQCGPATDTSSSYLWIMAVVLPIALLVVGVSIWMCCPCSPGDGRSLGTTSYRSKLKNLKWCRRVNVETQDNRFNEQESKNQLHHREVELEPMLQGPSSPRRNLVPEPGEDPFQVLRLSFYIFAAKIPNGEWKKFGRNLNMSENDLPLDCSDEAFFEMLNKWLRREGAKSSVNTLLDTLDRLDLRGVADAVVSELIMKKYFKYEES